MSARLSVCACMLGLVCACFLSLNVASECADDRDASSVSIKDFLTRLRVTWTVAAGCRLITSFDSHASPRSLAPACRFSRVMLNRSDGIDDTGELKWDLALLLLLSWVLCFICIVKGIKSSGKVSLRPDTRQRAARCRLNVVYHIVLDGLNTLCAISHSTAPRTAPSTPTLSLLEPLTISPPVPSQVSPLVPLL